MCERVWGQHDTRLQLTTNPKHTLNSMTHELGFSIHQLITVGNPKHADTQILT